MTIPTTIKALLLDTDGVLTDGSIWYDDAGHEWKGFHTRDGLILKALVRQGIPVGIITGRQSPMVARRASELGIPFLLQGQADKSVGFRQFCEQYGLQPAEIAYIGDDWNDWPAMQLAGFKVCPHDAAAGIRSRVDLVLDVAGGKGAVRAFVDLWKGVDFGKG